MAQHSGRQAPQSRSAELSLSRALPRGFHGQTRPLALIRADRAPGYLRESVFTVYDSGRWEMPRSGAPLAPAGGPAAGAERTFLLTRDAPSAAAPWQVELLAPEALPALPLPAHAATLSCGARALLADANGMVTAGEEIVLRYDVGVSAVHRPDTGAFPLPDGLSDPAYLALPAALAETISNGVAACEGLAGAESAPAAAARIQAHFIEHFSYRADARMPPRPDPLRDFLTRREGYCVHFATAAALMLRARGFPARVVGGYLCRDWNPWLGRWVVRERQGHAWVETWDAAAGRWLLVDATPPEGQPDTLAAPGRLRLLTDLLVAAWKRLIFLLTRGNILEALADAGGWFFAFLWHVLWSPAGGVLAAAAAGMWLWRRHRRREASSEEVRLRAELTATANRMVRRRVPERSRRREPESWDAWLDRVGAELPAATRSELARQIECYQQLRYRRRLDVSAARAWIDAHRRAGRRRHETKPSD